MTGRRGDPIMRHAGDPEPSLPAHGDAATNASPAPSEGAPAAEQQRRIGPLSSLRVRNYRLLFVGQLISVCGTWMQTIAQSFLVLDLSGSGTILGLTLAVRFGPMFLLAPWAGVMVDRLDRRRLLYATQALSAAISGQP
jgi:hypothetical protein